MGRDWRSALPWLILLLGSAGFLALKLHQFIAFDTHAELAEFEQVLWNTLQGRTLELGDFGVSFFSRHFSPILFLLVPLYAVFPSPVTLLVVQALVAAAAVAPLYFLAMTVLNDRRAAVALALAYLLSRVVNYGLMFNFHMEIFYPVLYFTLFVVMLRRRWGLYALCLILTVLVKEDAHVANSGLGLYLVATGSRRAGWATVVFSVVGLLATMQWIIPAFAPPAAEGGYQYTSYWSGFGQSQGEILRNMLNPLKQAQVLSAGDKPGKMFNVFSVFLFLPLLRWRPALFLVLPCWYMLFSSDNPLLYGLAVYYGLLITPFLFLATILVLQSLRGPGRWPRRLALWLPLALLTVNLANSRLWLQIRPDYWRVDSRWRTARELIDQVPPQEPVAAQPDLLAHFPVRPHRAIIPDGLARARFALFDLRGNPWPLDASVNEELARSLVADGGWESLQEREGFLLLRRSGH